MSDSGSESDVSVSVSVSAAAAESADKRRYVTWDGRAAEVLLHLRFDTMQRAFASHTNPLEVAALWTALVAQLQRLTDRAFTTAQCQGKLKALRTKWRVDAGRQGKQMPSEDFEKHALRWIASVNAQKRAKDKNKKSKQQLPIEASSESFAELLASLEAPAATQHLERTGDAAEEDYDYGFENVLYDEPDESEQGVQQQAAQVRKDEASLLALLRRQTKAVEAISNPSESSHEQWLELSREQVRLAREQVELNLFLVRADPEDAVAQEYLMLKRSEARDRLKRQVAAQSQQRKAHSDAIPADTSRVAIPRLSQVI